MPPRHLLAQAREPHEAESSVVGVCLSCLTAVAACFCCINPDISGEGGQRLLSTQGEGSSLAIEASSSPPRLPLGPAGDQAPLLKGQGPSSSALLPSASPPMPLPFFPPPTRRHRRHVSDASRGSGNGSGSGGTTPSGASPKAAAGKGEAEGRGSRLSLLEDEDVCPTCLDPYTEDNPRVLTRCGHHFHLPCLYEWLERSETCPVCAKPMQFEEIM